MSKKTDTERDEAIAQLRKLLKPGATVYTILRHVSASGMSRVIDLAIVAPAAKYSYDANSDAFNKCRGHEVRDIGWLAARAMGHAYDRKRGGIKIGGCGMDMGFELVYNLGRTLWPNGTPKPHSTRNGEPDNDGGYALNRRWL